MEPLRIREGGVSFLGDKLMTYRAHLIIQSIPSVPYLEKEFACHALHLPMGQSSVGLTLFFFQNPLFFFLTDELIRTKLTCLTNVFPLKTFAKERQSLNDSCSRSPKTIHLIRVFTHNLLVRWRELCSKPTLQFKGRSTKPTLNKL